MQTHMLHHVQHLPAGGCRAAHRPLPLQWQHLGHSSRTGIKRLPIQSQRTAWTRTRASTQPAQKDHAPAGSSDVAEEGQAANGAVASAPLTTAAAQPLVLPVGWEVQLDEVLAKYTYMDERLDAMERQMLEMTRELRTGTPSLTGGVTSMAKGASGSPETVPGTQYMRSGIGSLVGTSTGSGSSAPSPAPPDVAAAAASQAVSEIKRHGPPHASAAGRTDGSLIDKTVAKVHEAAEQFGGGTPGGTSASGSPTRVAVVSGSTPGAHGQPHDGQADQHTITASTDATGHPSTQPHAEHVKPAGPFEAIAAATKQAVDVMTGRAPPGPPFGNAGVTHPHHLAPLPSALTDASPSAPSIAVGARAEQLQAAREAALQAVKASAKREAGETAVAVGTAADVSAAASGKGGADADAAAGAKVQDEAKRTSIKEGSATAAASVGAAAAAQTAGTEGKGGKGLISRENMYELNRLQSAMTELLNSGYIESVKQLRETLLIQEWDLAARHLAKRRGIAMFERYVAERDLVNEIGGFEVLSALYEDPDAVSELLPNDRMRMLARALMEECLNERRMILYSACNETAKQMANLTSAGVSGRLLTPLKMSLKSGVLQLWVVLRRFWPFNMLPF